MQTITSDTIRSTLADGDLGMALSDFHAWAAATKALCLDEATELLRRYHHSDEEFLAGRIDYAEKNRQDIRTAQALNEILAQVPASPPAPLPNDAPATHPAFLRIRHKVQSEPVADHAFLTIIDVAMQNKGTTAMTKLTGNVRVSRAYPLPDPRQQAIREQLSDGRQAYFDLDPHITTLWRTQLDALQIELAPGERENIVFKRIIAGYLRCIEVHTTVYDHNQPGKLLAWKHTTFHFLNR